MNRPEEGKKGRQRTRLAILVNTMAPYRLPIYTALAESFETVVLHGGGEANRSWKVDVPPSLNTRRVWTIQIPINKQTGVTGVWDTQYVHLNLGLLWWLPRLRPHTILTNELGLRTLIAVLYGRVAWVPVWVQWEGTLHSERNVGGFKKLWRRWLASCIQRWISYGASSTEYLLSIGAQKSQVLQVQNCVPQENFLKQPSTALGQWFHDAPKPVILSVGQLIARKGLKKLIEACGRLAACGHVFTLVLVGDGPERDQLTAHADAVGLKQFQMLPNQSQEALNGIYRAADVFILPTLEDVWGLVVSEALWAGLPVLCSKYAGCAEVLPEENIFDPVSDASFDQALGRIFQGGVTAADSSLLLTWQEVSETTRRSIVQGSPDDGTGLRPAASVYTRV